MEMNETIFKATYFVATINYISNLIYIMAHFPRLKFIFMVLLNSLVVLIWDSTCCLVSEQILRLSMNRRCEYRKSFETCSPIPTFDWFRFQIMDYLPSKTINDLTSLLEKYHVLNGLHLVFTFLALSIVRQDWIIFANKLKILSKILYTSRIFSSTCEVLNRKPWIVNET